MRKWILVLVVLLAYFSTPPIAHAQEATPAQTKNPCEISAQDYAVYSAILSNNGMSENTEKERHNKPGLIVLDTTANRKDNAFVEWRFRPNSGQTPLTETAKNFEVRVSNTCHLQPLFAADIAPRLVPEKVIRDLFKQGDGWKKFYELYPKSLGYTDFSTVGYSDNGLEALVYVSHHCGSLCGAGHLFPLASEGGIWVVRNHTTLWIS